MDRSINRTIFGIESSFQNFFYLFTELSIAPSLELKVLQDIAKLEGLYVYQSHHLWN